MNVGSSIVFFLFLVIIVGVFVLILTVWLFPRFFSNKQKMLIGIWRTNFGDPAFSFLKGQKVVMEGYPPGNYKLRDNQLEITIDDNHHLFTIEKITKSQLILSDGDRAHIFQKDK